jgi:hypothetical protein
MRTRSPATTALRLATLALGLSIIHQAKAQSWVTTGPLNTARAYHTATLLTNGLVLVAGGLGFGGWLTNAELYTPSSAPPPPRPIIWTWAARRTRRRAHDTIVSRPRNEGVLIWRSAIQSVRSRGSNGNETITQAAFTTRIYGVILNYRLPSDSRRWVASRSVFRYGVFPVSGASA